MLVSCRDARMEASATMGVWCYASGPAQLWTELIMLHASWGSLIEVTVCYWLAIAISGTLLLPETDRI